MCGVPRHNYWSIAHGKKRLRTNYPKFSPPVQLPENSIIAKVDAEQLEAIAALHEKGINVTIIDIDVYHAEQSRALESRQQAHEHHLELRSLEEDFRERHHKRRMEALTWFGELAIKLSVLGGGLYFASIGSVQAGAILIGAVASTFAKDYMKGVLKK